MPKESSTATGVTKVQKLWDYIVSLCLANTECSVPVPSSNELARLFKVNRSTVQLALNKLSKAGFIYTKRGSGTFTNPIGFAINRKGIIGLVTLSGNQFFFTADQLQTIALYLMEIAKAGYGLRILNDEFRDQASAQKMLEHAYVDGLLTIGARPEPVLYAASQLPTVNLGTVIPGVSCVVHDDRDVLEQLRAEDGNPDKVELMTLLYHSHNYSFWHTLSSFEWANLHEISTVQNKEAITENIDSFFKEKTPDWIILSRDFFDLVKERAILAFGPEKARSIRWIILRRPLPESAQDFNAAALLSDDRAQIREALSLLEQKIRKENTENNVIGLHTTLDKVINPICERK